MSYPVVVLDADVPVLVCGVLLSRFDAELFQPIVSPTILAEVERALLIDFPHLRPDAPAERCIGGRASAHADPRPAQETRSAGTSPELGEQSSSVMRDWAT